MNLVELKSFELKIYRTALLFGVLVYAPIGYIYCDYIYDFPNDGFVERLPYAGYSLFGLVLSYCSARFNRYIRYYVLLCSLLITAHFLSLVNINNNHWLYLAGAIQVPLIMTTVFYHKLDAIIYYISCIFLGAYYLKLTPFYSSKVPGGVPQI